MKTKYRLLPRREFGQTKMYLQFLYTYKTRTWFGFGREVERSIWLFVPFKKSYCASGPLQQFDCDSVYDLFANYQSCYFGHEDFPNGVMDFTRQYPDIEVYFEHRRGMYQEYLEKQEKQKQAKIIEL